MVYEKTLFVVRCFSSHRFFLGISISFYDQMSAEPNIASPIVRGGTSEDVTWPFVLQSVGGKLYIHHVKLSLHDTGTVALQKLRRKYTLVKSEQPYRLLDKFPVFWKPVIQTAVLSPVRRFSSTCSSCLANAQPFLEQLVGFGSTKELSSSICQASKVRCRAYRCFSLP
jgi:hypothetical protein